MAKYFSETNSYGLTKSEMKRMQKAWRLMTDNGSHTAGAAPCVMFKVFPQYIEAWAIIKGRPFMIGDPHD